MNAVLKILLLISVQIINATICSQNLTSCNGHGTCLNGNCLCDLFFSGMNCENGYLQLLNSLKILEKKWLQLHE